MASTLKDVALRAGVSVRTVSNVVNNYVYVAEETRAKVQAAIDELGYRPNLLARNLKLGRSGIIGLVVPELDVPYFAELARLIVQEARAAGYTVLIDQTDGDERRERELVTEDPRGVSFDGMIVSPLSLTAEQFEARRTTAPVLLLGEQLFTARVDHVAIDNVAAAREATAHLISLGRTRIAAIGVQEGVGTAMLRTRGYREAFAQAGLPLDEALMIPTRFYHRADGATAMARLLDLPEPPDAVFAFSDLLALGAQRVALHRGLAVPRDVAIVGFDDIEDGRYSTPTLTTIAPDKAEIARAAVRQILARIDGTDADRGAGSKEIESPYRLVVRESTLGVTAA
ncbi:LacI family DNA-binding transcriptional regulator [Actinospica robiniae]|uniref:LacI family DNA-binding transcriptional regulator n=1 Tax=Actinospica robiniae TaxID=304901 RepID=UPI000429F4B9|nr:LacI family DNA-binding transcriptional regulator [Actinospica robiniae]